MSFLSSFLFSSALAIYSYNALKYLKKFDQEKFYKQAVKLILPISLIVGFFDFSLHILPEDGSLTYLVFYLMLVIPLFSFGFFITFYSYYK